jgi:hypothetical protein
MTNSSLKLACVAGLLGGLGLLLLTTRSVNLIADLRAHWTRVTGRLIRAERKRWVRLYGAPMEIVKVEYEFPVGSGRRVGSRFSSFDTWSIAYLQSKQLIAFADAIAGKFSGDRQIDVYVDAANPKRTRLAPMMPTEDLTTYFAEPAVMLLLSAGLFWLAWW